jgi:hypothetical protein
MRDEDNAIVGGVIAVAGGQRRRSDRPAAGS